MIHTPLLMQFRIIINLHILLFNANGKFPLLPLLMTSFKNIFCVIGSCTSSLPCHFCKKIFYVATIEFTNFDETLQLDV